MVNENQALVEYKGEMITVGFNDVKNLICPLANNQEISIFLKMCQSLQLNPFAREIYLIKYKDSEPASIVISIHAYLKASEINPQYQGSESGIILNTKAGIEYRSGSFHLPGELNEIVGGWARVYRKDRGYPSYVSVSKAECVKVTRDGNPTQFWSQPKQAMMLRKTALKRALVEAFPSLFSGIIDDAAISDSMGEPEDLNELPKAFDKGGEPDWKKFWARAKSELGLSPEKARELLKVESIKEELIDAGWKLEKIWDVLVETKRRNSTMTIEELYADDVAPAVEEKREPGYEPQYEPQSEATIEEKCEPVRAPSTIKTINDLLKACFDDFGMQPKQVLEELHAKNIKEIVDPASAYRQIAAPTTNGGE